MKEKIQGMDRKKWIITGIGIFLVACVCVLVFLVNRESGWQKGDPEAVCPYRLRTKKDGALVLEIEKAKEAGDGGFQLSEEKTVAGSLNVVSVAQTEEKDKTVYVFQGLQEGSADLTMEYKKTKPEGEVFCSLEVILQVNDAMEVTGTVLETEYPHSVRVGEAETNPCYYLENASEEENLIQISVYETEGENWYYYVEKEALFVSSIQIGDTVSLQVKGSGEKDVLTLYSEDAGISYEFTFGYDSEGKFVVEKAEEGQLSPRENAAKVGSIFLQ